MTSKPENSEFPNLILEEVEISEYFNDNYDSNEESNSDPVIEEESIHKNNSG